MRFSTTKVPTTTKLGKIVTYLNGFQPVRSHDPLIVVLQDHMTNLNQYISTTTATKLHYICWNGQ